MSTISKQTAMDIALAYREVETAEALLVQVDEAIARRGDADIRDVFGRRQDGLQLGVPSGDNSQRMFCVPWKVARPIIELHISNQRALIETLTLKACDEGRS